MDGMLYEAGKLMEQFRPSEEPSEGDVNRLVRTLRLADDADALTAFLDAGQAWGQDRRDDDYAQAEDLLRQTEGYPVQQQVILDLLRKHSRYSGLVDRYDS
jgi:hypothetical protein